MELCFEIVSSLPSSSSSSFSVVVPNIDDVILCKVNLTKHVNHVLSANSYAHNEWLTAQYNIHIYIFEIQ